MKEFLSVLGLVALIVVIVNWKKIFGASSGDSQSNDGALDSNASSRSENDMSCEYINDQGQIITVKGSSKDSDFVKMCEGYKSRTLPLYFPSYYGWWYPYRYAYGTPIVYYYYTQRPWRRHRR